MIIVKGVTVNQFIKVWEEAREAMERLERYSNSRAIEMAKVDWSQLETFDWSKPKCPMEVQK